MAKLKTELNETVSYWKTLWRSK